MRPGAIRLVGGAMLGLITVACGASASQGAGDPTEIVYDCFGVTTTIDELRQAPSVAELEDHPGFDAFAEHADDPDDWRAMVVEDDELAAISELDPPDELDGAERDYQRMVLTRLDEPAPPETDEEGWMVSSSGPCELRADLGELGPATLHLDGEALADEQTSQLRLLVMEQACASGEDASGRVEVAVDADSEEIRLLVGVRPGGGEQTCQGNPATPVTVDLDEPVGDRTVVDAGRYPPREITAAPADLQRAP